MSPPGRRQCTERARGAVARVAAIWAGVSLMPLVSTTSRMSAITFSRTATPAEPCCSKKAACGLNTATTSPIDSTMPRAQRSRPDAVCGSPHAVSSEACGSIPAHSGPLAARASAIIRLSEAVAAVAVR